MREWKKWEYRKPLEAKGGIKLHSARSKKLSMNWWSRRWLEFIERSIDTNRLARGRTYARRGQVLSIEVLPGMITAFVQGSRKKPYQVRLGFDAVSQEAKSALLFRLREHAHFAASLLAGEMPEDMAAAFKECGTQLFPDEQSVRRFKCSCPDEAEPCKHVVAVLLILSEVFDDDPFLILKLRGVDRDKLINLLTMESNECGSDFSFADDEPAAGEEWYDRDDGAEHPEISGGSDSNDLLSGDGGSDDGILETNWFSSDFPVFSYSPDEDRRRPAALEIMNEFPLWRGEHPFRQSLAVYYDRGANLAVEILTGEKRSQVGRPRKFV